MRISAVEKETITNIERQVIEKIVSLDKKLGGHLDIHKDVYNIIKSECAMLLEGMVHEIAGNELEIACKKEIVSVFRVVLHLADRSLLESGAKLRRLASGLLSSGHLAGINRSTIIDEKASLAYCEGKIISINDGRFVAKGYALDASLEKLFEWASYMIEDLKNLHALEAGLLRQGRSLARAGDDKSNLL